MAWIDIVILLSFVFGTMLYSMIGDKLKIGSLWLLFFTTTFTFLAGVIIVLLSDKLKENQTVKREPSKWYMTFIIGPFMLLGLISVWSIWNYFEYDIEAKATMVYPYESNLWIPFRYLIFGAGFVGAAVYLSESRKIIEKEKPVML